MHVDFDQIAAALAAYASGSRLYALTLGDGTGLELLVEAFAAAGVARQVRTEIADLPSLGAYVAAGLGERVAVAHEFEALGEMTPFRRE